MTWIDRPEIFITKQEGRLTAELRGGEVFRYDPHEVVREPGTTESICPTIDHIVAAAGYRSLHPQVEITTELVLVEE